MKRLTSFSRALAFIGTSLFLVSSASGQAIYERKVTPANPPSINLLDHDIVVVNATTGDVQVNLPALGNVPVGRHYTIKRSDDKNTVVTIQPQTGQTIDGLSNYVLANKYQQVRVVSDGAKWNVLSAPPSNILNASAFPGSDIGEKINAAHAALPATGGEILIDRGSYDFSHGILLTKSVVLRGSGQGTSTRKEPPFGGPFYGTRLNWTSGTGPAMPGDHSDGIASAGQPQRLLPGLFELQRRYRH